MTNELLETDLKLQLLDKLTDVLQAYQRGGKMPAQRAFERILTEYHRQYQQDKRLLALIGIIEALMRGQSQYTVLEIAELLGEVEMAIGAAK